jgi:hypothetical protein
LSHTSSFEFNAVSASFHHGASSQKIISKNRLFFNFFSSLFVRKTKKTASLRRAVKNYEKTPQKGRTLASAHSEERLSSIRSEGICRQFEPGPFPGPGFGHVFSAVSAAAGRFSGGT